MADSVLELNIHVPLDSFALEIKTPFEKRVMGVFGPSGSGKTTLIETVAGLRRQATGFLKCGTHVWMDSAKRIYQHTEARHIGFVPQDHLLFPHLNVEQNLTFSVNRNSNEANMRSFEGIVEVLELRPLLRRSPAQLSGGEKQRVSLGRALCSNPQLLILDEPMASLDQRLRHRILPLLLKIKDHFQTPILIVSHSPFELQALCDEVIAIDRGKIVAKGRPEEVFTQPQLYQNFDGESFKNLISAIIVEQAEHTTQIRLGDAKTSPLLNMIKINGKIGQKVLVGFPANDVIISNSFVAGVSARNQLQAKIEKIESLDHRLIVTTKLLGNPTQSVVVELTPNALKELRISQGDEIFILLKSSSITRYG